MCKFCKEDKGGFMKWINDETLDEMDCIISEEISKDFINEYVIAKKIADFLEDRINDLYRNILSGQDNSVTCNNCGEKLKEE